jgi:hypothetical protein
MSTTPFTILNNKVEVLFDELSTEVVVRKDAISYLENKIRILDEKINYLSLPWYKKLYLYFKKK